MEGGEKNRNKPLGRGLNGGRVRDVRKAGQSRKIIQTEMPRKLVTIIGDGLWSSGEKRRTYEYFSVVGL